MKDSFDQIASSVATSQVSKAEALHALGAFYLRQGFPKQGLSLLLAASKFAPPSLELRRALAHAYVLAGAPKQAISLLDELTPKLETASLRSTASKLRARALLALGRVSEARAMFADSCRDAPRRLQGGRSGAAR